MKFIGIYGIIIGSSVSYFADAVITFYLLKKQNLINLDWKELITFNVKIFFASLIFGLFCYFFFVFWGKTNYYGNIFEESLLVKFLYLGLISLAGIFVYYLILKITKIDIKKLLR
jgi:peptidoglycan biosynthesis protein MviN/MurJ (putative lipid II flippase)